MLKNREWLILVAAALAGYAGGFSAVRLSQVPTASAADQARLPAARGAEPADVNQPGVVSARKFVLLSEDKKLRAILTTDKEGMPVMQFFDPKGIQRVMLAVGSGGSSFMLYGPTGTNHAGLVVAPDGEPQLYMLDKDAKVSAILASQPEGGTLFALYPGGGKPRAVMAVLANGASVLNLIDQRGSEAFKAP